MYRKNGIRYLETGPQLETNSKILSQWEMFDKQQHKRRRCYVKDIVPVTTADSPSEQKEEALV